MSDFSNLEIAFNLTTRGLPMSNFRPVFKTCISILGMTLSLALIWGCASSPAEKQLEQLNKVLRVYNNAFESKSENGGSGYVQNDYRMDYLLKYGEIQSKVNFLQVQTLNHAYFKAGKPLEINVENPEGEFDEAIITMRYQVTISPSNTLKTFIHEQRWKHNGVTWLLQPNLEPFLR
ncbi:MAG: hypothetical protein OEZ51_08160 [Nitrospinota bacterium]|nr:hypothetical protein [Nitrospinota bacterium]